MSTAGHGRPHDEGPYDAVVVGAGLAGLYMLHRLRGLGMTACVLEAGDDIGGTWYWNRYPGARCDVESVFYAYSFSRELVDEWEWTERYPTQPELLRYIHHVADRFDLRRDIRVSTRVTRAAFDEAARAWVLTTDDGDTVTATHCVMATGCLSAPRTPDFTGLDDFRGEVYSTAEWPHTPVDFTGKRVGVIGTGSSGIQAIPQIAAQAARLTVFQRTANFSVPAHNGPLSPTRAAWVRDNFEWYATDGKYTALFGTPPPPTPLLSVSVEEREQQFESKWREGGLGVIAVYPDIVVNAAANDVFADFIRDKIRATVTDPRTADDLCPDDHYFATKRPCVDIDYYATYNRDNVQLVNLRREPITSITEDGIATTAAMYDLDAIVLATGFDAMTGSLLRIDIRGSDGLALRDAWADGPRTFLGLMVAGFPNLFTITGPGSPSVLGNVITHIEQHVDWIAEALAFLRSSGLRTIEARTEEQDAWVAHVNEIAGFTLYPSASSWYVGANIPGKPRVFMPYIGGMPAYRARCDDLAARDYADCILGT
ncbi:MAG TPA: NAD(P)/FAD-dependent oxidoreductase [Acidimicrobiia bacterium]|nr:NAD(P)/FAD-dependent oxidoreductase [Acidimicrobiia bacterium]